MVMIKYQEIREECIEKSYQNWKLKVNSIKSLIKNSYGAALKKTLELEKV